MTEVQSHWITTSKHFGPQPAEGFTVWFTGLSGSGKSTLAELLVDVLERRGHRYELLDGDVVRTHLSKGLGFSKEDRDTNILRIGWVAERRRTTAPPRCARHLPVPRGPGPGPGHHPRLRGGLRAVLEECARQDRKGLYEKAFRGEITGFTGVDDPYEPPENPEVVVDTERRSPEECLDILVRRLEELGYLRPAA